MPSWRDVVPERWLKARHLEGRAFTVTIVKVTLEPVYDRAEHKNKMRLAAHLAKTPKLLLLTKTNLETLEQISGSEDYDLWAGLKVQLSPKTTKVGDTIVIASLAVAQAQVTGANTPLHGQMHGQVHGLDSDVDFEGKLHGQPVHGLPQDIALDGAEEEVQQPGEHYEKSTEPDRTDGPNPVQQEALFFSITDLQDRVKQLHNESDGPMTHQQHAFIMRQLGTLTGKDALTIVSMLCGRAVDANNPAGEKVGRYLYDLIREGSPLPIESAALLDFVKHYVPSAKTKEKK